MKIKLSFFLIFIFLLLSGCSFDNKTGIWKEHNQKIIEKEQVIQENKKRIYTKRDTFDQEIESKDIITVSKIRKNESWIENNLSQSNDVGHLEYENNKNSIFKSKKIGKNRYKIESINPAPLIIDNNIFFSDLSGNIFCYSIDTEKIVWKFNFYKKKIKNIPIKINLKILSNNLIVSDNLGYFYNINLTTGRLFWAKNQGVPLTSEIKTYGEKIFLLNQDNKFYVFQKNNGEKILDFETFPVVLKKNNRQSLALGSNNDLYFATSAGQIFSINHESFKINWLKNIKNVSSSDEYGLFNSSPLIVKKESVFISSSQNTISLSTSSGSILWEIPFGTIVRPVLSGRFIFLISKNGFILNSDINSGKIIWSKKLFNSKELDINKIGEVNSLLLLSDQLFFTTKNGYFFFVNYENGDIINYAKVSKGFYSKPAVANGKIYIIDKNMRVLVFN